MDLIIRKILELRPGESIWFGIREVASVMPPPPGFTTADWLSEKIVGSAYEFLISEDVMNRIIVVHRISLLPVDDERKTYVSPDRRHLYDQTPDGFYVPSK